jgi:hypothetical protein
MFLSWKTSHLLVGHIFSYQSPYSTLRCYMVMLLSSHYVKIIWIISVGTKQTAKIWIFCHILLHIYKLTLNCGYSLETWQMGQRIWIKTSVTLTKYHLYYKVNSEFWSMCKNVGSLMSSWASSLVEFIFFFYFIVVIISGRREAL